jgi:tRNA pseudouridine(38-40) synthase
LIYTVRGSGFLHHMVRNLVGTFLLVGKGTVSLEDLRRILEARERSAAGPTAPPAGCIWWRWNTGPRPQASSVIQERSKSLVH